MNTYFYVILFLVTGLGDGLRSNIANIKNELEDSSYASIEYFTKVHQNYTINMMIHMDKELTNQLDKVYRPKTRQKLKLLTHDIVRDVGAFFQHPSLNRRIHFKILETRFLKNKTSVVPMDENASKYLQSYCEWQGEKKRDNWYYSVLLTGLDLFYVTDAGKRVRKSSGRSYIGGMCSQHHSCSILEWHPKIMGFLIAHEIAHSLDIPHDEPPQKCKQGHIMGAKYTLNNLPRTWSKCSRRSLKRYLASDNAWCLSSVADSNQ